MKSPVLTFSGISRSFGSFEALRGVSFDLAPGTIVALVGANGAGKSTLLKIAGGVHPASAGAMLLDGHPFRPATPQQAKRAGIASVFQELNLFLTMSVAENIFVDAGRRTALGLVDWKGMQDEARRILAEAGVEVAADAVVSGLGVAQQQMVEVVRALHGRPKILLLDEPTASLSEDQAAWLFSKVRQAAAAGTAVLYVSHRLDEVTELCERCVILRDGVLAATLAREEIRKDLIIRHMVGREITAGRRPRAAAGDAALAAPGVPARAGAPVTFECRDLSVHGRVEHVSFQLHRGEILGIAGLVGAGRTELLNALYGVLRPTGGGTYRDGRELQVREPAAALRNGLATVSEDRKREGLFFGETVSTNLNASSVANRPLLGLMDPGRERARAAGIAGHIALEARHLPAPVDRLSGGNQQKVVLGRALLTDAEVLLLDEPTRGVDVGAREDIYAVIEDAADRGAGVVIVSSDWEELVKLADRVLVLRDGQVVGELVGGDINESAMLHLCTGQKKRTADAETESRGLAGLARSLFSSSNRIVVLSALLAAVFVAGSFASPFFLNRVNLSNLAWQSFVYLLLTLGQLAAVIGGGIDLSVSATLTVASVVGVRVYAAFPGATVPALLASLAAAAAIGLLNGLLVVRGRLNAFIATLGVGIVLQGVSLIITPRPIAPAPPVLKYLANGTWAGVPIVVVLGALFVGAAWVVLRHTGPGRRLYAVGESSVKASWTGLPVSRTRVASFVVSALLAGLAAFYLLGRSGGAEPAVDPRLTLDSIAYCLIGGATLAGGRGSVGGSVITILLMIMLLNVLGHSGVGIFYQQIIRALLLLVIVIAYNRAGARQSTVS